MAECVPLPMARGILSSTRRSSDPGARNSEESSVYVLRFPAKIITELFCLGMVGEVCVGREGGAHTTHEAFCCFCSHARVTVHPATPTDCYPRVSPPPATPRVVTATAGITHTPTPVQGTREGRRVSQALLPRTARTAPRSPPAAPDVPRDCGVKQSGGPTAAAHNGSRYSRMPPA